MTNITLQDGSVVLRGGKVGTEQACCCGCDCGTNCEQEITIEWVRDGLSATLTVPFDGTVVTEPDSAAGDTGFALFQASASCGNLGPNGECGWLVELLTCGCDPYDPFLFICGAFSSRLTAFIPYGEDGCPEAGEYEFVCDDGDDPCEDTATGTI
jgi:hypothetical protein